MQYKPVLIDGRPYAVHLATGGAFHGAESEWDSMLDVLGEKNPIYHAKSILSWCQDTDRDDAGCRVYRGQISPRHWNSTHSYRCEYSHIGYRPVLEPLDPQTLQPVPETLRDIPDGTVLTLGSLYLNGIAQPLPTDPNWCGNIPQYRAGAILAIGDTAKDAQTQLRFIKCGSLLWCDRNLLTCISWDTLSSFGLIYGQAYEPVSTICAQNKPSLDHRLASAGQAEKSCASSPKSSPFRSDDLSRL